MLWQTSFLRQPGCNTCESGFLPLGIQMRRCLQILEHMTHCCGFQGYFCSRDFCQSPSQLSSNWHSSTTSDNFRQLVPRCVELKISPCPTCLVDMSWSPYQVADRHGLPSFGVAMERPRRVSRIYLLGSLRGGFVWGCWQVIVTMVGKSLFCFGGFVYMLIFTSPWSLQNKWIHMIQSEHDVFFE